MMISASDNYYHCPNDCPFQDCERGYCPEHRLLFRDCDTAYRDIEGDGNVINGLRLFWTTDHECPACLREVKQRQYQEQVKKWNERFHREVSNG